MRFFLSTYQVFENFEISKQHSVFGGPRDETGFESKFLNLSPDDFVLIRNASGKNMYLSLEAFCRVVGKVVDQDQDADTSPYSDLLWHDEKKSGRIIYPLRVAVDFINVPRLTRALNEISWHHLYQLDFYNEKGDAMNDKQRWLKKFRGNFVEDEYEVAGLCDLLGISAR